MIGLPVLWLNLIRNTNIRAVHAQPLGKTIDIATHCRPIDTSAGNKTRL